MEDDNDPFSSRTQGDSEAEVRLVGPHSNVTLELNDCIHEMIQKVAARQPMTAAVCAWDGQLSYEELDTRSTSLAACLIQHGVGLELYVPVFSEKSVWVPMAMLAILKAGGAFVLLDPANPPVRLEMCRIVDARIILSSKDLAKNAGKLAPDVVVIMPDLRGDLIVQPAARVQAKNAAYAIFTSGTSGRLKGAVIQHDSFSSSAMAHARALDMGADSLVLQFASYAFDACITEILMALIVGACIVVPSEEGRLNDLAGQCRHLQPNWALLTPSVTRVHNVEDYSMLRTLVLGGEAVQTTDILNWAPHVALFIAYGVSECSVINMVRRCSADGDIEHPNLGFGVVGELWLDWPYIGRGYINDEMLTAQVFVDPPSWHPSFPAHDPDKRKLYKTGGLVSVCHKDGSIHYVKRKDQRVKLRDQCLEVQEVESCLRRALPATRVDVATIDGIETLVASVLPDLENDLLYDDSNNHGFLKSNDEFRTAVKLAQQRLSVDIPKWMVPAVFLPLQSMPLMASGKGDRRRLCAIVNDLTTSQLQSYTSCLSSCDKRQPVEAKAQTVVAPRAEVLHLDPQDIGLDDSFFVLGGNSVSVMKLAAAARRRGLDLPIHLI
ncbi:hypothetical protein F5Y16DRAFT_403936 [Xylariaceae sp. FL0255]|nr:hypothetical protein F5Y16DRAFT_403936 [Xylariaceae sp. FL0255]